MNPHEDILGRMGAANPATGDDAAMDAEFALLTSLLDQRRSTMTDLDERRVEPTPPPTRRVSLWRAVTAFAGALVIVLGAIGVVALVRDGGSGGDVGSPGQTAPDVTEVSEMDEGSSSATDLGPQATTQPEVNVAPPPLAAHAWSRVEVNAAVMPEGTELVDVVHTGSAFWIVGHADGCAQVWTSPDGDAWNRLAMDPDSALPCGASLSDVAVGTDATVVVGTLGDAPAIWVTTDGVAWAEVGRGSTALGTSDSISAITAGAEGFVAVGTEVWHSPDGFEWVQAATPWIAHGGGDQVVFDYETLTDVQYGDAGYIALSDVGDWGKDVLLSADGTDWTATNVLSGIAYDETPCFVYTNAVTSGPAGYVIVGDCVPEEVEVVYSSVWTSLDGLTWSQIEFDEVAFGDPALISDVTFDGETYLAVGWTLTENASHATVWHSEDGLTWIRTQLSDDGGSMAEIAASTDSAIAIGQAEGAPAIWRGAR